MAAELINHLFGRKREIHPKNLFDGIPKAEFQETDIDGITVRTCIPEYGAGHLLASRIPLVPGAIEAVTLHGAKDGRKQGECGDAINFFTFQGEDPKTNLVLIDFFDGLSPSDQIKDALKGLDTDVIAAEVCRGMVGDKEFLDKASMMAKTYFNKKQFYNHYRTSISLWHHEVRALESLLIFYNSIRAERLKQTAFEYGVDPATMPGAFDGVFSTTGFVYKQGCPQLFAHNFRSLADIYSVGPNDLLSLDYNYAVDAVVQQYTHATGQKLDPYLKIDPSIVGDTPVYNSALNYQCATPDDAICGFPVGMNPTAQSPFYSAFLVSSDGGYDPERLAIPKLERVSRMQKMFDDFREGSLPYADNPLLKDDASLAIVYGIEAPSLTYRFANSEIPSVWYDGASKINVQLQQELIYLRNLVSSKKK